MQRGDRKYRTRDTHFDNETTNGLGVHVVAHVLQRTPRHRRTTTSTHASKIRPGPGIPPGYIVPIAKRSPPLQHRASFHAFRRDPATQWGFTSRSSIFLGRIDPRVKLTAMGRGEGAEGRTQRARWSLMEPYGALWSLML